MDQITPASDNRAPISKREGLRWLVARIVTFVFAVATFGVLVIFLTRDYATGSRSKARSGAVRVKPVSTESEVGTGKGVASKTARPDESGRSTTHEKSNDSGSLSRAVRLVSIPQPSAYTRELVGNLCRLDKPKIPKTLEEAVEWKKQLQELVLQGRDAVPALVEFLKQNKDLDFDPSVSVTVGFTSVRQAFFDVMLQIGGPEGLSGTLETLRYTAEPREIALLAQNLEKLAPEQYRQDGIQAAREALAMAASGKLEGTDVAPLFEVLHRYGETSVVSELMESAKQWNYYSAIALAQLPDGGGVPKLIQTAQGTSSGRLSALEMLAQVSAQYPEARSALLEMARANSISPNMWPYLIPLLSGDVYHYQDSAFAPSPQDDGTVSQSAHVNFGNQHFYVAPDLAGLTTDLINDRIALIEEIQSVTSDSAALNALHKAREILARRMPQPVVVSH